jgi:hypothetical protein
MKLHAIVSNERTSKTLAGNEYLDIDLSAEVDGQIIEFARFTLREGETPDGDEGIVLLDQHDEPINWFSYQKDGLSKVETRDCSNAAGSLNPCIA